jgi:LysM repeat protein
MPLKNPFKLEKLTIKAFANEQRQGRPQDTFTVMFNPTSYTMTYANVLANVPGVNTSGSRARYSYSRAEILTLELVLDGTGVTDFGLTTLLGQGTKSVSAQVKHFLELCFYLDGEVHEPKFLKIQWGEGVLQNFDCRLQGVDVTYTAFDKNGAPLRATLNTTFLEDLEPAKRLRKENKSSPDLPHTRIVRNGDTLPLLTKEIYGSSVYYLRVAQLNGLDNFRQLTPGQEIFFPPLEQQSQP